MIHPLKRTNNDAPKTIEQRLRERVEVLEVALEAALEGLRRRQAVELATIYERFEHQHRDSVLDVRASMAWRE